MNPPIKPVFKLDLEPGDILHVRIGGDIGEGHPPWIPTQEDLDKARDAWLAVVPDRVRVMVTHHLVNTQVLKVTHD